MTDQNPLIGMDRFPADDPGRNLAHSNTFGPMPIRRGPDPTEQQALQRCIGLDHPRRQRGQEEIACRFCLNVILLGEARAVEQLVNGPLPDEVPEASRELLRLLRGGGQWLLPDLVTRVNAERKQPQTEATVSARLRDLRKVGYPVASGKDAGQRVRYWLALG